MLTAIFVFTAAMLVLSSIKMVGAILGNGITMPSILPLVDIGPASSIVMYPSVLFQVWFWTDKLGLV